MKKSEGNIFRNHYERHVAEGKFRVDPAPSAGKVSTDLTNNITENKIQIPFENPAGGNKRFTCYGLINCNDESPDNKQCQYCQDIECGNIQR